MAISRNESRPTTEKNGLIPSLIFPACAATFKKEPWLHAPSLPWCHFFFLSGPFGGGGVAVAKKLCWQGGGSDLFFGKRKQKRAEDPRKDKMQNCVCTTFFLDTNFFFLHTRPTDAIGEMNFFLRQRKKKRVRPQPREGGENNTCARKGKIGPPYLWRTFLFF